MKNALLIILLFFVSYSHAQKRVEQGVLYSAGEKVYGPVAGLESAIPEGWMGILPQGTESFLLIPTDNSNAQIIVLVVKDDINSINERWQKKAEFANGIFLQAKEEPYDRNGWLATEIDISGSSNHPNGYVEAKCGEWGLCTINLLLTSDSDYEKHVEDLRKFSDACILSEPKLTSRYADFDWLSYLQNKALIRWSHEPNFKTNNQVHLCADGKFQSRLKTSGIVKGEKSPYFGKNYGEWEVQGVGPTAKLYLYFNKLSPLIVDVEMREGGNLFINNIQYFSMESDKCAD